MRRIFSTSNASLHCSSLVSLRTGRCAGAGCRVLLGKTLEIRVGTESRFNPQPIH